MQYKLRIALVVPALVAAALLAGCGSSGPGSEVRSSFVEFTPEQQQQIEHQVRGEYEIEAGDYLKVAFIHQTELNQDSILVLPDGSVNLIGVDRIALAGLTMTEADSTITAAYSREFRDPQLSVILQETHGTRVYVLGEVASPGLMEVPRGGLSVIGAVSLAGGFTDHAAREGSVLVRVAPEGYLVSEMDLSNFQSLEYASLAMVELQSYDIIYVPRSRTGDFHYFSRTVLAGLLNITRMAADIYFITNGTGLVRY